MRRRTGVAIAVVAVLALATGCVQSRAWAQEVGARALEGEVRCLSFTVSPGEVVLATGDLDVVSEGEIVINGPIFAYGRQSRQGASIKLRSRTRIVLNAPIVPGRGVPGLAKREAGGDGGELILEAPEIISNQSVIRGADGGNGGCGGGMGGKGGSVMVHGCLRHADGRTTVTIIGGRGGDGGPGDDGTPDSPSGKMSGHGGAGGAAVAQPYSDPQPPGDGPGGAGGNGGGGGTASPGRQPEPGERVRVYTPGRGGPGGLGGKGNGECGGQPCADGRIGRDGQAGGYVDDARAR